MLGLKDIKKDYVSGTNVVNALKGVTLEFKDREFVSVLGPSGCGKTTLLNIIGGLDKYTSGDLIINGTSTAGFQDRDWDAYRNHSIGFVFQSYNLIPHQTILRNVELALTISGKSKSESERLAKEALKKVGLEGLENKKPNQLSGGQMQRVAIARAIVNNPDILLADEPTGALDSVTSELVMDILREIAKTRLVIMVTHNAELAEQYSTRIIRLKDGLVESDDVVNREYYKEVGEEIETQKQTAEKSEESPEPQAENKKNKSKKNKASMSFWTALSLSFSNLLTKKGRTVMISFAGSIGIIGIALILSMSNGVNQYIKRIQEDTLSTYPIEIEAETIDYSAMLESFTPSGSSDDSTYLTEEEMVYTDTSFADRLNSLSAQMQTNDLKSFKSYLEDNKGELASKISDIKYTYDINLNIYTKADDPVKVNPSNLLEKVYSKLYGGATIGNQLDYMPSSMSASMESWKELLSNDDLLSQQYTVLKGSMPKNHNEVVIVVDKSNQVGLDVLYALGLVSEEEIDQMFAGYKDTKRVEVIDKRFSFDELIGKKFTLIYDADFYSYDAETGIAADKSNDEEFVKTALQGGMTLTVVGILRPAQDSVSTAMQNGIGYTHALIDRSIAEIKEKTVIKAQQNSPKKDIFTGQYFAVEKAASMLLNTSKIETIKEMMKQYGMSEQDIDAMIEAMGGEEAFMEMVSAYMKMEDEFTLESNLNKLGYVDESSPKAIAIYPKDFKAKEDIVSFIKGYNSKVDDSQQIKYTDYVGILMSSVTDILNAVTYSLIAFVAISLIVSSIMIGVITYISVLERTKEIGILRSIGASKGDIATVFNAETLIIGFAAGIFGIAISLILIVPINLIIKSVSGIAHIAVLPVVGAFALVAISMFLTFVSGLFPSRFAAKRDPVVALRTE